MKEPILKKAILIITDSEDKAEALCEKAFLKMPDGQYEETLLDVRVIKTAEEARSLVNNYSHPEYPLIELKEVNLDSSHSSYHRIAMALSRFGDKDLGV